MKNVITISAPRVLFPVQITPNAFESLNESPLSSLLSQRDFESDICYLEVGESRVNTGELITDYLDEQFTGLLDAAFEAETDVIEFSK
ncbi:hypothetical protein [Moritella sp. F3]|uniref:hypothetical protein n=1 Tax=Moritella sp. F3 TaxID=2718882 RepID=UPI0018E1A0F3|nr:hypothetical protein [Moritella sp. F3]GIC77691.1 hypothetical protein FMO001_24180 [Moritella sp. F1]GIC82104.1 hypothetical protein FMO003_23850 [Moritella sp. F3]